MTKQILIVLVFLSLLSFKGFSQSKNGMIPDSCLTIEPLGDEVNVYSPIEQIKYKAQKNEIYHSFYLRVISLYRKRGWNVVGIYNSSSFRPTYYLEK
jgi:hypothetical protein